MGLIGGWFANVHDWRAKKYEDKYPQKSVDTL